MTDEEYEAALNTLTGDFPAALAAIKPVMLDPERGRTAARDERVIRFAYDHWRDVKQVAATISQLHIIAREDISYKSEHKQR